MTKEQACPYCGAEEDALDVIDMDVHTRDKVLCEYACMVCSETWTETFKWDSIKAIPKNKKRKKHKDDFE